MTTTFRRWFVVSAVATALCLLLVLLFGTRERAGSSPGPAIAVPARGGQLVATMRAEPATFNRYVNALFPTHLISLLTQAPLVRIDRLTHELQPWLARSWSASDDRRTWTLELRQDVAWSDGVPFTADDVVFSVKAAQSAAGSRMTGVLRLAGEPITVRANGPHEIVVTFPIPYAPGVRVLDALPIYPKHALQPALAQGAFDQAWGTDVDPARMPGLGPFVLESYAPAQRVVLARNPRYWRTDERGIRLPYLDRLTLEIVPDQNAELLRLTAGQADLLQSELRPEDYRAVKEAADAGRLRLIDAGPSQDRYMLWFNLAGPASAASRRSFLRHDEFRLAVSLAVDRQAFADTVYLGAAVPSADPVPPGNTQWTADDLPRPRYDPARAAALLDDLGLHDTDGDGLREDGAGRPVRFSILVQAGVTAGETGARFLRDALAQVGIDVDVAALDLTAMMSRWFQGEYDAIFHYMISTDTDPAGNLDWWLSRGDSHLWAPGQQTPATAWEARIDDLMLQQVSASASAERRRLFAEVQRIFMRHNPALFFAAPRVFVATSPRVLAAPPARQRPQLLWDAESLAVATPDR